MIFDVRTAALDEASERRVRLAVSLLGADSLQAEVTPWDGTRCHLLVALSDDEYGRRALSLALRRGTPVLALGSRYASLDVDPLPVQGTAASLVREIRQRLSSIRPAGPGPRRTEAVANGAERLPMLCRLAQPPLRGRVVALKGRGRAVLIHPEAGRAYAHSASDLLVGWEGFATQNWRARVVNDAIEPTGLASSSLESFLLRAAMDNEQGLPAFPQGRYQLKVWPDLGGVPGMVAALKLSKLLIDRPMNPAELLEHDQDNMGQCGINACLWAFAAADLLHAVGSTDTRRLPGSGNSRAPRLPWWSAIARRFGL